MYYFENGTLGDNIINFGLQGTQQDTNLQP